MRKVFVFLILILFHNALADDVKCDICRKTVKGQYYSYSLPSGGKKIVCQRCEQKSNKCELCGIPLKSGAVIKGYHLCENCEESAKFCSLCDTMIKGRYIMSDGKYFCNKCANSQPKCSLCGAPVAAPRNWDQKSKLLCPRCNEKAVYCSRCGILITGGYSKYQGSDKIICDTCLKDAQKCDRCKTVLMISEGHKVRDKMICDKCYNDAEVCYLCGNSIVSSTFSFKYAKGKFCEHCIKTRPACDICGRPIGEEIYMFPDGRRLCDECHQEVVTSESEINKIHKEVISILAADLNIKIINMPKVNIVDSKTLQGFFGKQGTWSQTAELGAFRVIGSEKGIYILQGLPKTLVYETLAHETAHVFQHERNPKLKKEKVIEGFAQWVAAKVLEKKGFHPELDKLTERTDIYGEGYREVLQWEFEHGAAYVIGKLKTE